MKASDFLIVAEKLADQDKQGRPRQVFLRRAVSSTYYALFHTVAQCCADTLIGTKSADRSSRAWRQVYRALDHKEAKRSCMQIENHGETSKKHQKVEPSFPQEVRDLAASFVTMQDKRHNADYDPYKNFRASEVLADIEKTSEIIKQFIKVPLKHRRAFATFVLFKRRNA